MRSKAKGSALVDYILPTALVGVVFGLALFSFTQNNTILSFLCNSLNLKQGVKGQLILDSASTTSAAITTPSTTVTPTTPTSTSASTTAPTPTSFSTGCTGNVCNIDLGNYQLTNIPSNLGEFVETAGAAGGTERMVSVLEQIAAQLEAEGDLAGAEQFKDLANLGHFIADAQNQIEIRAGQCSTQASGQASCFDNNMPSNYAVPANVQKFFSSNTLYHGREFFILGEARRDMQSGKTSKGMNDYATPAYQMVDLYESIMDNNNYDDKIKGLTTMALENINELAFHQYNNANGFAQSAYGDSATSYEKVSFADPTNVSTEISSSTPSLSSILHPQVSIGTDMNASIICAAGYNSSTGYSCK